MSNTCCYIAQKGIDDEIAARLGWRGKPTDAFTPHRVATLRGMYDETNPNEPLNTENLNEAARKIAKFRGEIKIANRAKINNTGTNIVSSFRQLRKNFTAEERYNRVNMLADMFSQLVDSIQKSNPHLSRKDIIEGYDTAEGRACGEFVIFEKLYDQIVELQARFANDREKALKFNQVLSNWPALVTFTRLRLRDIEGVKLGNKMEFASEADEANYGDNNLSKLFDPSESIKEAWQMSSGMESAFGSLGKQVRRLISTLPVMEYVSVKTEDGRVMTKAVPKRDDLGHIITLDPIAVHQQLLDILSGMTSASHMMGLFMNPTTKKPKAPWMISIVEALKNNDVLRTKFYVDLKRNFQLYTILTENKKTKKKGFKTFLVNFLNKKQDLLKGSFFARILLGNKLNEKTSVYDIQGNVNTENLKKVKERIIEWLAEPEQQGKPLTNVRSKFWTKGVASFQERRQFISDTLSSLGVEVDADTLMQIMSNSKDLRQVTNALRDLAKYGLSDNQINSITNSKEKVSYRNLIKAKKGNEKESKFEEKIRKIHEIITKNREGLRVESKVRHKNSKGDTITLYSQVTPSYLGDRMDEIQSYVKANDKAGLRSYIKSQYLNSSFFYYNGKVLNKWLEELLKCCDTPDNIHLEDTFAAQFTYLRDLGTDDIDFENFDKKQHIIDMYTSYRSDKETSHKATTALYPVFILGDSGVSKYIRAKRYSQEEIIDGMYNNYTQELRRQKLVKASNAWCDINGYKKIENFSSKENTFSTLVFLNENFKAADGSVGKYAAMLKENPTEAEVKQVIQTYLKDSVKDFKDKMGEHGLLQTITVKEYDKKNKTVVEVERYKYLGEDVTAENVDDVITDFYTNVKFATINQLQLMTIDPSFYKNTKDLQKRYKEIHAPGTILDTQAKDKNGKFYAADSEGNLDATEYCVYFDDISLNAEEFDAEFMNAIAAVHGKNSDIYNKYKKNTLTDGQGYRTLKSYRKVMGMAGKWTDEMQEVYDAIEQLKTDYVANGKSITADKLSEISKKAVVFQPIKPYMFTHENISLNEEGETLQVPVQHKYAEAVLIPELLPEGSMMRDIAYWMDNNNVDMIGSTKCVKVGSFGSADISQAKDSSSLNEALNKAYIHKLDYSDYRIQTNVPEHINSSQLFGTQIRKLIMAGIKMDVEGDTRYLHYIGNNGVVNLGGTHKKVKLTGRNLIAFYNSLITANILDSYEDFSKVVNDPNKFSEILIQNVINNARESQDDLFSYAIGEDGNFAMPLFEGGLEHDASALAFSLFRKMVNKQQIKGGSAVQVSALGIKSYEKTGDLEYEKDSNGNITYVQCELPFDLSYTDSEGNEVSLDFDEYCNPDGTLKMTKFGGQEISLLEHRFPGITTFVAYRIPTERDYSMVNMKVVRFSRKTAGGTLKLPPQITTIMGADFDIDKLYFMMKEFKAKKKQTTNTAIDNMISRVFMEDSSKILEFEEYDYNKDPLQNSRVARNNMIIHLIQQRLMDPETLADRTTPGAFNNASKAARISREFEFGDTKGLIKKDGSIDWEALDERSKNADSDPEPDYDVSDPMTIITYNQQNQVASKLIGIFANQNTNHAFASLMQSFKVTTPIEFAGHSYGDFLHAPKGINVDLNMAELLAASVDAVKDPVLNFMNLNTLTADAAATLIRLGYTATEVSMLFNQPIIKEVCEYSFDNNIGIDIAIREIKSKYKEQGATLKSEGEKLDPSHFTMDNLAKNLITARKSKDSNKNAMDNNSFATSQLEILNLFKEILLVSKDVSNLITATKFTAANSVGSTFGDMYAQQIKVQEYLSTIGTEASRVKMVVSPRVPNPVRNDNDLLLKTREEYLDTVIDSPFAFEQAMYDMNRKILELLNEKYFPYDTLVYKKARNIMARLVNYGNLDADTINSIHNDMMTYLLSKQERSVFNGSLPKKTRYGVMTSREYYTKWFARDILDHLNVNPHLKSMPIFKYLLPDTMEVRDLKTGNVEEELSVNIQGVGGLDSYVRDSIKDSWAELSKEFPQIATDLFLYNFYKLGFNFSPFSFMNLAPTEVKERIQVSSNDAEVVMYKGEPLVLYRGYATEGGFEAEDIDDTVRGEASDYIDESFGAKYHFTIQEDAENYSKVHEQRYHEKGKTNHKRVVSKYWLSSDTKYKVYKDIIDANKHKDEWKDIDAIILENGTLGDGRYEVIVTAKAKNKILSSPIYRSYVDFLNQVKNGNKFDINDNTFARQYLLNHLDNNKFGLNARTKTTLDILKPLAISRNVIRDEFNIDVLALKEHSKYFAKENGQTKERVFTPIIKMEVSNQKLVYMADNFDPTKSTIMTYRRVSELGTKGKSLQYVGEDCASDAVADMHLEESFIYGNTSQSIDDILDDSNDNLEYSREAAIDMIAEEMSKAYEKAGMRDEQGETLSANSLKSYLMRQDDEVLKATVNDIRQACRQDGVIILDENGQPMKAC